MTDRAHDIRPRSLAGLPAPPNLSDAQNPSLFLDFDGTLVEIANVPGAIEVLAGLPRLLQRIDAMLGGRLAVVSGRALADLARHLGPLGLSGRQDPQLPQEL
jgi:trehalose 6-phosphate phosphatase